MQKAVRLALKYYDKVYKFSLHKRNKQSIISVESVTDNIEVNTRKVLEASDEIKC